jgi:hypothetical protein
MNDPRLSNRLIPLESLDCVVVEHLSLHYFKAAFRKFTSTCKSPLASPFRSFMNVLSGSPAVAQAM